MYSHLHPAQRFGFDGACEMRMACTIRDLAAVQASEAEPRYISNGPRRAGVDMEVPVYL